MSAGRAHAMPFGAELRPDGTVRFRLWAPAQERLSVVIEGRRQPFPMAASADGWHELQTDAAAAGARYWFQLADGMRAPDPASRYQPQDVHGPSEIVDPRAYEWWGTSWRGRPWHEASVYELHVGTFTPEGTFAAIIEKLDHLVDLGITAIELMPIAEFPGARNWGYDGVLLFAPDASYGQPDDLKSLVDAAHARELMVFLDVVYNHFGPDGNYLPLYAPPIFTDRHKTPWGDAVNYDGTQSAPVREFVIHNALYWLEEFCFDGLRLDAIHAIVDDSPRHLLDELAQRIREAFGAERQVHLILENEENESRWLARGPHKHALRYDAQWNDDVHHALHAAATGETSGYYAEYEGDTAKLARSLAEGFAFQGEVMAWRGRPRGEPSSHLPPTAFIAFMQNHDQIGNRAFGERITALAPTDAVRAIAAVYLLAPEIPMLFMGEEWAAAQPFPFFCDFEGELATAVREGRRAEFARFPEFQDAAARERIPDPGSETTFRSARLDWADRVHPPHAEWLAWYRRVLAVRTREIVPALEFAVGGAADYQVFGRGAFRCRWRLAERRLVLVTNLSPETAAGIAIGPGRVIWREGSASYADTITDPWSVAWSIEGQPDQADNAL